MAEFKFYLNRQGARGPQGPQGEKGFSPDISVEKDTLSEYILRITNEGGYFLTTNLREHKEDRGGTYIRYDRATGVMYAGDADYASTEKYGVVRLATEEDLLTQEESLAVSSAILNGYLEKYYLNKVNDDVVTGNVSFKGRTGFTQPIHVNGLRGDNENQYLTRSDTSTAIGSLTIPDNDDRLMKGSNEIAYTSDLANFVTNAVLNNTLIKYVTTDTLDSELSAKVGIDTTETITGEKTFTKDVTIQGFNKAITLNGNGSAAGKIYVDKNFGGIQIYGRESSTSSFDSIAYFNTKAASINTHLFIEGNRAFHTKNLVAGKGIDFSEVNGITTISSTGGGSSTLPIATKTTLGGVIVGDGLTVLEDGTLSAQVTGVQLEALQRLINDLSTKVDNLTTRLNNLEEVIDGGVAGSIYPADPQKIDALSDADSGIENGKAVSEDIQIKDGE